MPQGNAHDLAVGSRLTGRPVENITRTDIVRYAGASGDFTPLHHDEPYAQAVGNPGVFAMGMLTAGYLARALDDWFGPGALMRYRVRFRDRVWPGDSLRFRGVVRQRDPAAGTITVDLEVINQNEVVVASGEAEARV